MIDALGQSGWFFAPSFEQLYFDSSSFSREWNNWTWNPFDMMGVGYGCIGRCSAMRYSFMVLPYKIPYLKEDGDDASNTFRAFNPTQAEGRNLFNTANRLAFGPKSLGLRFFH